MRLAHFRTYADGSNDPSWTGPLSSFFDHRDISERRLTPFCARFGAKTSAKKPRGRKGGKWDENNRVNWSALTYSNAPRQLLESLILYTHHEYLGFAVLA